MVAKNYASLTTADIDKLEALTYEEFTDWYFDQMSEYNYDFNDDNDPVNCDNCYQRLTDYTQMRKKFGRVLDPDCLRTVAEKMWDLYPDHTQRYLTLVIKMGNPSSKL